MVLGSIQEDFSEEVTSWALQSWQGFDRWKSQLGVGRGRRGWLGGKRHTRGRSNIRGSDACICLWSGDVEEEAKKGQMERVLKATMKQVLPSNGNERMH